MHPDDKRSTGRRLLLLYASVTSITMAVTLVSMFSHQDVIFFEWPLRVPGRSIITGVWATNNLVGLIGLPVVGIALRQSRRRPERVIGAIAIALAVIYLIALLWDLAGNL